MRSALIIPACAIMCSPWHAPAQIAPADRVQNIARDAAVQSAPEKVASGVANGPTDRLLGSSIVPQLQLSAGTDEKVATLSWSFATSAAQKANRLSYDQFTFKISTALDEDNSRTTLLDPSGYPGGTELKLNYTHFSGAISIPQGSQLDEIRETVLQAKKRCEEDYAGSPAAVIALKCDPNSGDFDGSTSTLVEQYAPKMFDRIFGYYYPETPFHFYGLEAGANQDNYKYLDRNAFTISKNSKFGFSATAFAGLLWIKDYASLTASFTYARRYEAQAPVTLCQAINATQEQCLTAPDGAPGVTRKAVVSIEGRHAFGSKNGGPPRYAIAPSFSYDAKNEAFAVDVPFYLASDGEGKLRGGVRVGYTNVRKTGGGREDDATIALFVGVPFSLFR